MFRAGLRDNPDEALKEFELSPAERVALATNHEDALRRLSGADVAAFGTGLPNCQLQSLNAVGASLGLLQEICVPCQQPPPVAVPPTQGVVCARPVSAGAP